MLECMPSLDIKCRTELPAIANSLEQINKIQMGTLCQACDRRVSKNVLGVISLLQSIQEGKNSPTAGQVATYSDFYRSCIKRCELWCVEKVQPRSTPGNLFPRLEDHFGPVAMQEKVAVFKHMQENKANEIDFGTVKTFRSFRWMLDTDFFLHAEEQAKDIIKQHRVLFGGSLKDGKPDMDGDDCFEPPNKAMCLAQSLPSSSGKQNPKAKAKAKIAQDKIAERKGTIMKMFLKQK